MTAPKPTRPRSVKDTDLAPQLTAAEQALALDIEKVKGEHRTHEKVCEERMLALNKSIGDLGDDISSVDGKVDDLGAKMDAIAKTMAELTTAHATAIGVAKGLAEARKPKWWVGPMMVIAGVLLSGAIGLFGFMASRIMSDNDRAIADAKQRPTASSTVTVNPAQAPVTVSPPQP